MIALNNNRNTAAPKKRKSTIKTNRKTSAKQRAANRRNAQQSTGPKSKSGKTRSRKNALKHGLFADHLPLSSAPFMRNEEAYHALVEQYIEDFQPRSQIEVTLIETLAVDFMRLRHIHALESAIWDTNPVNERAIEKLQNSINLHGNGRSSGEYEKDIAMLKKFQAALEKGTKAGMSAAEQTHLTDLLAHRFKHLKDWISHEERNLDYLSDTQFAQQLTEEDLVKRRSQTKAAMAKAIEDEKVRGIAAHGCKSDDDIRAIVSGKRKVPKGKRDLWAATLTYLVNDAQNRVKSMARYEQQMEELRKRHLGNELMELPRLELLAKYDVMLRRSIERTLKELKLLRHELLV